MLATCKLADVELWSGLDRDDPAIHAHIATCSSCQDRAKDLKRSIAAVTEAAGGASMLPQTIGSYRIVRPLGEGGMGLVYEGEQSRPRRRVAVKVVRGGQYVDEYRLRLFQREAETLARLKHAGIAAIYEAGRTDDGQHFFAMELVQGVSLMEYVRTKALPQRQRLDLFFHICDAINYAHQRGVIHRDLKPTNILVDAEGKPKVLDFGLARIVDPNVAVTTTGTEIAKIMGTLAYMRPEEARGEIAEIDTRSDVYALGVIFYEMLTGALPYTVSRMALHEAVRIICEELPSRPSTINRAVRGDLETIALTALQKERGRRYQSAAAFADDVRRFLADEPILARRAGPIYRLRKLLVRRKTVVMLCGLLAALLIGGWIWVLQIENQLAEVRQFEQESSDRMLAQVYLEAAVGRHQDGYLDIRTERYYRDALAAFARLGRNDTNVASVKLGLAELLTSRPEATGAELREALQMLQDAVAVFGWGGAEQEANHNRALEVLDSVQMRLNPEMPTVLPAPRPREGGPRVGLLAPPRDSELTSEKGAKR